MRCDMEAPLVSMMLTLPDQAVSVPLCRRIHRHLCGELGVDPERCAEIEVVISEATSNVICHAYAQSGHQYSVTVEFYPAAVQLAVEDQGRGFERPERLEPLLDRIGGRGLWLIEQLADEVRFTTAPGGGCRLEACFKLNSPVSLSGAEGAENAPVLPDAPTAQGASARQIQEQSLPG